MGLCDWFVPFGSISKCLYGKTHGSSYEAPRPTTSDYSVQYTCAWSDGWWCRNVDDSYAAYYWLSWWCFCIGRGTRRELMISVLCREIESRLRSRMSAHSALTPAARAPQSTGDYTARVSANPCAPLIYPFNLWVVIRIPY